MRVSIHKALNLSRGVIRCRELSGMSEKEIKTELQEQGVVEVHKVTVKRDTEKVPTGTLFLTFSTPEMPKDITVGYLKVKVALFVPNPMRCFDCNKFGHTSQRCKVAAKCQWRGKDKNEGRCEGPRRKVSVVGVRDPSYALIAMVPTLHWLKIGLAEGVGNSARPR